MKVNNKNLIKIFFNKSQKISGYKRKRRSTLNTFGNVEFKENFVEVKMWDYSNPKKPVVYIQSFKNKHIKRYEIWNRGIK